MVEEDEDVEDVDPFLPPDVGSSNDMVLKQFLKGAINIKKRLVLLEIDKEWIPKLTRQGVTVREGVKIKKGKVWSVKRYQL